MSDTCQDDAAAPVETVTEEKSPEPECAETCKGEEEESGSGESDPCTDPDYAGGDPQEKYRELCRRTTECKSFYKKLTECNDRVNSRTKTEEKCVEEVIDYFHCVDNCAAKRFFKLLK